MIYMKLKKIIKKNEINFLIYNINKKAINEINEISKIYLKNSVEVRDLSHRIREISDEIKVI